MCAPSGGRLFRRCGVCHEDVDDEGQQDDYASDGEELKSVIR